MAEASRPCPSCATPVPLEAITCPSCGALSLPGAAEGAAEGIARRLGEALGRRYRLERELGRGGMAVVFLAHDLRHDRPVALKVLLPELSRYLGVERFLREIHIAAQLNHPHILALHDSGEADGLLFYVMPYVEGDSLRRRLLREGRLPVAEAAGIAAEVADGLAYAHHRGVVHRDVKPENLLLAEGHAVIADFGIARALAGAGSGATITTTGISLGTPTYMSPEQAAGDPAVDHRTDIYALGCTVYEMLTGQPPYSGPTPQALVLQHLADPVPSARALRAEVPAGLDVAIRRAMAKHAADRFPTAAEFGAALGGAGTATARRPLGGFLPARPRRRALAIGAAVLVCAVAAAAVVERLGHGPAAASAGSRAPLRVVVRPFEDRSGRSRTLADRLTESLTEHLQPVPALAVTASAVVADLGDAPLDTLRARFAPDRIVVGRVDEAGSGLRVAAQIIDARTGRALADTSLPVDGAAGFVDSVAGLLSVFVRHSFWDELARDADRARVRDAATWDLVERARDLRDAAQRAALERLDRTAFRSLDVADSLLRAAQRRDGASDLIPIELARVAELRGFAAEFLAQALRIPPGDLPAPAAEYARALGLLDRLIRDRRGPADAFERRGMIKEGLFRAVGADSLLEAATADFNAATELDPHRASAWLALGSALLSAGRHAEALLAAEHASEEDVFQLDRPTLLRLRFDAAMGVQRFDVAEGACREGTAEMPDDQRFRDCGLQLWSRTRADRRSAARAAARADSLAARYGDDLAGVFRRLWVAGILARAGLGDSADRVARRALEGAPRGWMPLLLPEAAYLRLQRGDRDSAIALAAVAVRADTTVRRYLRIAPEFRPLRADARWLAVVGGTAPTP